MFVYTRPAFAEQAGGECGILCQNKENDDVGNITETEDAICVLSIFDEKKKTPNRLVLAAFFFIPGSRSNVCGTPAYSSSGLPRTLG
jgi:hypothetical protein